MKKNKKKLLVGLAVVCLLLLAWCNSGPKVADDSTGRFTTNLAEVGFAAPHVEKQTSFEPCAMPSPLKPIPECGGRTSGRQSTSILVARTEVAGCLVVLKRSVNDQSTYFVTRIADRDVLKGDVVFAQPQPTKAQVEQFILANKTFFPCAK